jgi:hypothetical protein
MMKTSAIALTLTLASVIPLTPALALAQATPQPSAAPQSSAAPQTSPAPRASPQTSPVAQPQASATPAASAAPQGASAPVDIKSLTKHSNPNFNPCGGWRQMLVSYAGATNCVLDAGEVIVGANYAATYIPVGTQLVLNGSTAATSTYANTHAFPATPLGVGLGGRWQFSYTPPENQDLVGFNHNIDKSGATNQVFSFRNMFFFNRCFTYCGGDALSAVFFTYVPPTGSSAWRGTGPSYSFAFSSTVAVEKSPKGMGRILINLYDPVSYAVVSSTPGPGSSPGHVTWGWSSTLLTTMIWIHHSWRLNTSVGYLIPGHQWVWNINPNYLISRRLVVGANYGGAGVALTSQTGVSPNFIALTNTTRPRFLDFSIYYLIGHTIPPIKGLPEPPPGD